MPRRPRIVMGAYSCHPTLGSEPTVGWNRAVESARFGRVDVITHDEGNEAVVRRTVRERGLTGLRFHFVPHTAVERALMHFPGGFYLGYRSWQRRAFRVARDLHRREPFDLAHQVNMCGYREPGELWRLGAPFVWGPVGGTQNTPTAFLGTGDLRMALGEGLRSVLNRVQLRLSPRVRRAAAAADVLLAANSTVRRDLEATFGIQVQQLLETGIRAVGEPRRWADRAPGPFRVLWAGEVVHRKGIRLVLDALARLRAEGGPEVELVVVGDGSASDLLDGAPGVTPLGWIPRADLLALYAEVDALAFTSLRDTSGNVMLEALAAGLPVVYLDHQGAADMGSAQAGIPVPVTTPEAAVAGVAAGIAALATDPARYDRLSRGAVARARALHWTTNGDAVNALYADVLGTAPLLSGDGLDGDALPSLSPSP